MHVRNRLPALLALLPLTLVGLPRFCKAQLPDSPAPSASVSSARNLPPQYPADSPDPLTLKERFVLQTKLSFSVAAIIDPAFEAAITMADPPSHYPRDWADGAEAFGRNYGSELGRHAASGYTHFAAASALREDPRYFRYNGTGVGKRALHAVLFTLVDRRDSGRKTLAVSNFIGAAGGGFSGMLWEPDGFDDVTHAYQRTAVELGGYGSTNLLYEFSPELTKLLEKCRLGRFRKLMPTPPVDAPRASQP